MSRSVGRSNTNLEVGEEIQRSALEHSIEETVEISNGDEEDSESDEEDSESDEEDSESDEEVADEGRADNTELDFQLDQRFIGLYIPNNFPNYTAEQVYAYQFPTYDDAELFYRNYARHTGFSERLKYIYRSQTDRRILVRTIVCNKEGWREKKWLEKEDRCKAPQRQTRCNCKAGIKIKWNKTGKVYQIVEFRPDHNHTLANPKYNHLFRSRRKVSAAARHCRKVMEACSISTSKCFDYLVTSSGGHKFVGFTMKDFFNSKYTKEDAVELKEEGERRRSLVHGDADDLIDYMEFMEEADPGFFCMYGLDEEGRLANIFWRDSNSFHDYSRFGDVLLFDSTYKTNMYGRPLVLFVGVNHHRASVLFGAAILVDERTETFVWALKMFKLAMGETTPAPPSILTDGDEAMHNAVLVEFPDSTHRVCAWHVARNMAIRIKDKETKRLFKRCLYRSMTEEEFDNTWRRMVDKMQESDGGISHNVGVWLEAMYRKRKRWAETFFRAQFFAMCKTTQRVEGLNNHLKGGLTKCSRLSQVPLKISKALSRMRNAVVEEDFKTFNGTPVLTSGMEDVERKLADRLTDHVYKLATYNIKKEADFQVIDRQPLGDGHLYKLKRYKKDHDWEWTVERDAVGNMTCSCRLFESDGIPCRHMFCVLKNEFIFELPDSLIHHRWCRGPDDDYSRSDNLQFGRDSDLHNLRCASLNVISNRICFVGSLTSEAYQKVFQDLIKLDNEVKRYRTEDNVMNARGIRGLSHRRTVNRDPECHKSRKRQKAETRAAAEKAGNSGVNCSHCHAAGHTIKTCKEWKDEVARRNYEESVQRVAQAQAACASAANLFASRCAGYGSDNFPEADSEGLPDSPDEYPEHGYIGTAHISQTQ